MLSVFILSSLLLLSQHAHAQTKVVRILLDSDPSIDYEPADFWHSSLVPCDDCPKIDQSLTFNNTGTFHNGTHSEPFTDPDDLTGKPGKRRRGRRKRSRPPNAGGGGEQEAPAGPSPTPSTTTTTTTSTSSKSSSSSSSSSQQQQQPPPQQQQQQQQQQTQQQQTTTTTTTTPGGTAPANTKAGTGTLATSGPGFTNGPDADDSNFVPDTVSVTFRFTGQSAQVHAIVPNFIFPGMLSTTNVSFSIDGVDTGLPFIFKPVAGPAGSKSFTPKMILNIGSLDDGPHTLVAKLAPESILIFDYLNYTAWSTDPLPSPGGNPSSTATAPGHELTGGSTVVTKHNVLTFALAVGLSVGLLFIGAVCLWISIWRRRVNSRRRLKLLEEEEAENARRFGLDPEEVRGPIPFMPRYFPGTVPPSPPPYEGGAADVEVQNTAAVTTTHSLSSPVTLQRLPLGPETRQPMSTPAVSITRSFVSIPGSTSNRTEGTDRRHSIISTGSVNIPFTSAETAGDERVASPTPPGLAMPRPTRISSPSLLSRNLEEEDEGSSGVQLEGHRPRSIRSIRGRRVGSPSSGTGVDSIVRDRREDEMSDTESGALLRSSSLSSNSRRLQGVGVGALEPYRDEPPHTVDGPGRGDDVR